MKKRIFSLLGGVVVLSAIPLFNTMNINNTLSTDESRSVKEDTYLDVGDHVIEMEANGNFSGSVIHNLDGTQEIWMWGANESGQLGIGSTTSDFRSPIQIDTSSMLQEGDSVANLELGYNHAGAIIDNADGTHEVWMWGNNDYGQLGNGTNTSSNTPIEVDYIGADVEIIDFNLDGNSSQIFIQNADGSREIWMWGENESGQLGNWANTDSNVPVLVNTSQMLNETGDVIVMAELGGYHAGAVVLNPDGTEEIWTWGNNRYGQLGDGSTTNSNIPVLVYTLEEVLGNFAIVTDFEMGENHTIILTEMIDGTQEIWSWGDNQYGQLGFVNAGEPFYEKVPVHIEIHNYIGNDRVIDLDAEVNNTGIVSRDANITDDQIWMWGANESGQLGNGTNVNSEEPVLVDAIDLNDWVQNGDFAVGGNHTLVALQNLDGTQEVWSWGLNSNGQLGNGTDVSTNTPIMIAKNYE